MSSQQNPVQANLLDRRLASITRWAIYWRSQPKSVAEHSYYVARIARGICHLLLESKKPRTKGKGRQRKLEIDTLKVIDMALIHDEHEIQTGDIPHTVESDPAVKKALLPIAERFMTDFYTFFPNGQRFVDIWREYYTDSPQDGIEKQIVRVADTLAGYMEAQEEVARGNQIYMGLFKNYGALLERFDYEWFKPIKDALSLRGV